MVVDQAGRGITHRNYAKQCGLTTLSSYHQVALHTSPCLSLNARTPRRGVSSALHSLTSHRGKSFQGTSLSQYDGNSVISLSKLLLVDGDDA